MNLHIGDKVEIINANSAFYGCCGVVHSAPVYPFSTPHWMVLLRVEQRPMLFGERELQRDSDD